MVAVIELGKCIPHTIFCIFSQTYVSYSTLLHRRWLKYLHYSRGTSAVSASQLKKFKLNGLKPWKIIRNMQQFISSPFVEINLQGVHKVAHQRKSNIYFQGWLHQLFEIRLTNLKHVCKRKSSFLWMLLNISGLMGLISSRIRCLTCFKLASFTV